jgi:hypothetical protein
MEKHSIITSSSFSSFSTTPPLAIVVAIHHLASPSQPMPTKSLKRT